MPVNVVKTKRDERLWNTAKQQAAKQGRKNDWQYVMGIYQRMKHRVGGTKFASESIMYGFIDELEKLAKLKAPGLWAGMKTVPLWAGLDLISHPEYTRDERLRSVAGTVADWGVGLPAWSITQRAVSPRASAFIANRILGVNPREMKIRSHIAAGGNRWRKAFERASRKGIPMKGLTRKGALAKGMGTAAGIASGMMAWNLTSKILRRMFPNLYPSEKNE